MASSIVQWNIRGFNGNFEELCLLSKLYKPAVIGLQETLLTDLKTPSMTGFSILTKSSPNDKATGGVALLLNKLMLIFLVKFN